jgi:hypothetical protein
VGQQKQSGGFPEGINMLLLPGIERRSRGHYSVSGHYTRGVQTDGSHTVRKLGNRRTSIRQSARFFVGRLLVSVLIVTNKLVLVRFD